MSHLLIGTSLVIAIGLLVFFLVSRSSSSSSSSSENMEARIRTTEEEGSKENNAERVSNLESRVASVTERAKKLRKRFDKLKSNSLLQFGDDKLELLSLFKLQKKHTKNVHNKSKWDYGLVLEDKGIDIGGNYLDYDNKRLAAADYYTWYLYNGNEKSYYMYKGGGLAFNPAPPYIN